jgi:hypothetical protein
MVRGSVWHSLRVVVVIRVVWTHVRIEPRVVIGIIRVKPIVVVKIVGFVVLEIVLRDVGASLLAPVIVICRTGPLAG